MKLLLLTSVLSSLSLSSASNGKKIKETKTTSLSSSSSSSSLSGHHEVLAQLKRQAHEKFAVPKSFAGKIRKATNLKLKELSLSQAELQKLHESNESEEMHLRGLGMKNNFIQYTYYSDEACGTFQTTFGQLVNTCYNEQSKSTGAERSYLVKVNKKENLVVELEYEGSNCKGIPSKVTNLVGGTFPGWSTCFSGPGYSLLFDYTITYPSFESGNYVSLTSPDEYCSTTENKNYNSYYATPLSYVIYPYCFPSGGNYYALYSNSSCATEGQVYVSIYSDAECATAPLETDGIFDPPCTAEVVDDDDDDDYVDDYDYVETGVVVTSKCT